MPSIACRGRIVFGLAALGLGALAGGAAAAATLPDARALVVARGDRPGARRMLEELVKTQPDNGEVHFLLGEVLYDLREFDGAAREAERAVDLGVTSSRCHLLLGKATAARLRQAGLLSKFFLALKVKREFERAVEADPRDAEAGVALMAFYAEAPGIVGGGLQKAQDEVKRIAALDPVEGHLALAELYALQKKRAERGREFELAVQADPKRAKARAGLGAFYAEQDRLDEAREQFRACLELDPDCFPGYYYVGRVDVARGERLDEAEAYLKKYLSRWPDEVSPGWGAAHLRLAELYEKQGKPQMATANRDEAYRLNPRLNDPASCNCSK